MGDGMNFDLFNTGAPNGSSSILSSLPQNSYLSNPSGPTGSSVGDGAGSFLSSLGGWFGGKDKDGNTQVGALGAGLGALQGLGNLYAGFQSYGLAKQQLAFQQKAYETNLRNSVGSYNTALEDKIRGRSSNYAGKEADVQSYLASHKLST